MNGLGLPLMAGSIASSYAKRLLDPRFYDRVMETGPGRSLKALEPGRKYTLEFLAYVLNAVMDAHMGEDTAARKFFKNVATDGVSEVATRTVYGRPGRSYGPESLLELRANELQFFLDWFGRADEHQRRVIVRFIKRKTARQLGKLLRLHPRDRDRLVNLLMHRPEPFWSRRITWLDRITGHLNGR